MAFIEESWDGEEEVWKVFWVYGVLLIFLAKVCAVASRLVLPVDYASVNYHGLFLTLLRSAYSLWLVVSLWRCAPNSDWKTTTFMIRLLVLVFVVGLCALSYWERKIIEPWDVTDYEQFLKDHGAKLAIVWKIITLSLKRVGIGR